MGREIDCQVLLDQCWAKLNRAYEEAYGVKGYGYTRPEFRFVLSHDEIMALRKHAAKLATAARVYEIKGGVEERLFNHPIVEQRRTPYLEIISPTNGEGE